MSHCVKFLGIALEKIEGKSQGNMNVILDEKGFFLLSLSCDLTPFNYVRKELGNYKETKYKEVVPLKMRE